MLEALQPMYLRVLLFRCGVVNRSAFHRSVLSPENVAFNFLADAHGVDGVLDERITALAVLLKVNTDGSFVHGLWRLAVDVHHIQQYDRLGSDQQADALKMLAEMQLRAVEFEFLHADLLFAAPCCLDKVSDSLERLLFLAQLVDEALNLLQNLDSLAIAA